MADIQPMSEIVQKVRHALFAKGVNGVRSLRRAFKRADWSGNGRLDAEEFEEALESAGVFLPVRDVNKLMRHLDLDGSGCVCFEEMTDLLSVPLEGRRLAIVEASFRLLDRDGCGTITVSDLTGKFNTLKHPGVASGDMTEEEAMKDFLDGFDGRRGDDDGAVTKEEFLSYYADLSSTCPTEDYFVEMMQSAWMIDEDDLDGPSLETVDKLDTFEAMMRAKIEEKRKPSESEELAMRRFFKHFDTDESGVVTVNEFQAALLRLGIPLERRQTMAFFVRYDPDNTGAIDYTEFVTKLYRGE
eukprot:PLAT15357.1.p2 GENE.PLAT15357.1~~PLAT15357.1.p2  ORF type:complete len:300 (-),score=129.53 PLAT15357.1:102-1001(-)